MLIDRKGPTLQAELINAPCSDAWFATVAHYRAWLLADGGFLQEFNSNGARFDAALIRRMARYYQVTRTMPAVVSDETTIKGESNRQEENFSIVAKEMNTLAKRWPGTLPGRAQKVITTAQEIRKKTGGTRAPYSAVSKFIWLAQPCGWTLFDNFASKGIPTKGTTTEERLTSFYALLNGPLDELCAPLRKICGSSGLPLRPERIVDIVLMMRGAERMKSKFGEDLKAECQSFIDLLPCTLRNRLSTAAQRISCAFPDQVLLCLSPPFLR